MFFQCFKFIITKYSSTLPFWSKQMSFSFGEGFFSTDFLAFRQKNRFSIEIYISGMVNSNAIYEKDKKIKIKKKTMLKLSNLPVILGHSWIMGLACNFPDFCIKKPNSLALSSHFYIFINTHTKKNYCKYFNYLKY